MYLHTLKGADDQEWPEDTTIVVTNKSEDKSKDKAPANPVRSVSPWILGCTGLVLAIMLCKK